MNKDEPETIAVSGTRRSYKELVDRFYEKFEVVTESGCWLWTACLLPNGYGAIQLNGKKVSAHRVSWMIHNGKINNGKFVLHKCDVKRCVNPDHLFLGSQSDNVKDRDKKGRGADFKGIKNPAAKITASQLRKAWSYL